MPPRAFSVLASFPYIYRSIKSRRLPGSKVGRMLNFLYDEVKASAARDCVKGCASAEAASSHIQSRSRG